MDAKKFNQRVLSWFVKHGRHNLPWQKQVNSYRVWLSEIMLQQTQVATVIDYFKRFTQTFPSLKQLAQASEDQVLQLWTGLGYYNRARNLHKTAQIVQQQFRGRFPRDLETLMQLPGIGRSTAGAILSLAQQQYGVILDGNVKRVLTRHFAIAGLVSKSDVQKKLWDLSARLTPQKRCHEFNQAMMDLGATLCTRSKPNCSNCPLQKTCCAYAQGNPQAYPTRKNAVQKPKRAVALLILRKANGAILLQKRPPTGIWASLWSFPECTSTKQLEQTCQALGYQVANYQALPKIWHHFSHFSLHIEPIIIDIGKTRAKGVASSDSLWYKIGQVLPGGSSAVVQKLLTKLGEAT